VVLKYSPKLTFVQDFGIERGNRVMEILDELDSPDLPADSEKE
jgi:ribosome-binding factor A